MKNLKKRTIIFTLLCAAAIFTCHNVPDYCGRGELYDPGCKFCFGGETHDLCGGESYNPAAEGCAQDSAQSAVGARCLDGSLVPLGAVCGGYTLTVAVIPDSGGRVTRRFPGWANIPAGQQVALNAAPEEGYAFAGWTTGAKDSATTVTMGGTSADKPLAAVFKPVDAPGAATRRLITAAFPEAGGVVQRGPDKDAYNNNEAVTVTAVAKQGYKFIGWAGSDTTRNAALTLSLDESKTLAAVFAPIAYTLTVRAAPTEGGAVFVNGTASTGATYRDSGSTLELRAVAAKGYGFTGWSGAASGARNPDTIYIMDANKTITANFQPTGGGMPPPPPFTVKILSAGSGASPDSSYTAGTTVSISAGTPPEGTQFKSWIGKVHFANSNIPRTTFTMPAKAVTVTAYFVDANIKLGTFTDARDSRTYGTVEIGGMTWLSENLNASIPGADSWCYDNQDSNCVKYGRLYDWETAKTACPTGWRLPTIQEIKGLIAAAGGAGDSSAGDTDNACKALKSTYGWLVSNGTDDYGFTALPAGFRNYWDGEFTYAGNRSGWWASTEYDENNAYYMFMYHHNNAVFDYFNHKGQGFSVRCVQDAVNTADAGDVGVTGDNKD